MNIALGCDEAGFDLKQIIASKLKELGHSIEDYGCYDKNPVLYPEIGRKVAEAIAAGKHERGILICGTGIGMCITANKIPRVSAAVCHDSFSAVRSRCSNNVQIMCLGARVIGNELAKQLLEIWLSNNFSGGGSTDKIHKINEIEKIYRR